MSCNVFKNGNYIIYTKKMIERDKQWFDESESLLKQIYTIKTFEIEEMILDYSAKLVQEAKKKSIDISHIIK